MKNAFASNKSYQVPGTSQKVYALTRIAKTLKATPRLLHNGKCVCFNKLKIKKTSGTPVSFVETQTGAHTENK